MDTKDQEGKSKGPAEKINKLTSIQVICRFRPSRSPSPFSPGALLGWGGKAPGAKEDLHGQSGRTDNYFDPGDGRSVGCMVGHFTAQSHSFTFDRVLWPRATQCDVYTTVSHVVQEVTAGFNGTILAYGQTSSGKTFTMEGPSLWDVGQMGIIPRSVDTLFESIAKADASLEFTVKVSYVEIYCEKIRDLLQPKNDNLQVRELKNGTVSIGDACEVYVANKMGVVEAVEQGKRFRTTAPTLMNAESSRSHSLLIITVAQTSNETGRCREGKLFLVDLAGSEKAKKTGAAGMRLEEAKNINRSLTTLGMVITALSQGNSYVPYRDSKLTRILQDSLGGNSQTALLICCTLEPEHSEETLSTLRFGERAKQVKNKVVLNEKLGAEELQVLVAKYKRVIANLQLSLSQCHCTAINSYISPVSMRSASIESASFKSFTPINSCKESSSQTHHFLFPSPASSKEFEADAKGHKKSFSSGSCNMWQTQMSRDISPSKLLSSTSTPSKSMNHSRSAESLASEVFQTPNCSERHIHLEGETASVHSDSTISDFNRTEFLTPPVLLPHSRTIKRPTPKGPKSERSSGSSSRASEKLNSQRNLSFLSTAPDAPYTCLDHKSSSLSLSAAQQFDLGPTDQLRFFDSVTNSYQLNHPCQMADKAIQTDLKVTMRKEMNELFDAEVSKLEVVFSTLREREEEARKEAKACREEAEDAKARLQEAESRLLKGKLLHSTSAPASLAPKERCSLKASENPDASVATFSPGFVSPGLEFSLQTEELPRDKQTVIYSQTLPPGSKPLNNLQYNKPIECFSSGVNFSHNSPPTQGKCGRKREASSSFSAYGSKQTIHLPPTPHNLLDSSTPSGQGDSGQTEITSPSSAFKMSLASSTTNFPSSFSIGRRDGRVCAPSHSSFYSTSIRQKDNLQKSGTSFLTSKFRPCPTSSMNGGTTQERQDPSFSSQFQPLPIPSMSGIIRSEQEDSIDFPILAQPGERELLLSYLAGGNATAEIEPLLNSIVNTETQDEKGIFLARSRHRSLTLPLQRRPKFGLRSRRERHSDPLQWLRTSSLGVTRDSSEESVRSQRSRVFDQDRLIELLATAGNDEVPGEQGSVNSSHRQAQAARSPPADPEPMFQAVPEQRERRQTQQPLQQISEQTAGDQTSDHPKANQLNGNPSVSAQLAAYQEVIENQETRIQSLQAQLHNLEINERGQYPKDDLVESLMQRNQELLLAKEANCKEVWLLKNQLDRTTAIPTKATAKATFNKRQRTSSPWWPSSTFQKAVIQGGLGTHRSPLNFARKYVIPKIRGGGRKEKANHQSPIDLGFGDNAKEMQYLEDLAKSKSKSKIQQQSVNQRKLPESKFDNSYDGNDGPQKPKLKFDTSYAGY